MAKITRSKDCANSPKNAFAQDFVIALLIGDESGIIEKAIDKNFQWRISKKTLLTSSYKVPAELKNIISIEIEHSITHGKVGAVSGTLILKDDKKLFSGILEFSSASAKKVKSLTLYWL